MGRNITRNRIVHGLVIIPSSRIPLLARPLDQPLQYGVEVGLLLGADAVAANLSMGHSLKIQRIDELIHRELLRKVGLVAQYQEGDTIQDWLLQKGMELFLGNRQRFLVGCINDIATAQWSAHQSAVRRRAQDLHDSVDASTILLPHGAKPRLTTQVPATATDNVNSSPSERVPPNKTYHFRVT